MITVPTDSEGGGTSSRFSGSKEGGGSSDIRAGEGVNVGRAGAGS